MTAQTRKVLIGATAALLVTCGAVALLAGLPLLPFEYQQARERWQQRHPRHYEVDVVWASGWSFGHARVEMRDDQFVRGVDLDSGQALDPGKRLAAGYFASIDNLFKILDPRLRSAWYWRVQLARQYPQLVRWFDPCVAPLSDVSFDAEFGYPTAISYNDGWCSNTFFTYSNVKITRFQPLP